MSVFASSIRAGRAFVELFLDDTKLVRGLRRAETRIKAFGAKLQGIGRRMVGIGLAAATPIALATRVFVGFDDQMRAVQAVIGATGEEFDLLNEKAKMLGRTTSFSAAQVAAGMLELGRAGFSPKQIDAAIASVLDLSRATGTELPEASNIAANTLRSFGLEADQMGRVADVMTATTMKHSLLREASASTLDRALVELFPFRPPRDVASCFRRVEFVLNFLEDREQFRESSFPTCHSV